ncbi:STAS domain-containing protein [Novosphingobium profundi]|uniref:STAS domain-containing protein n=1 Tax=Novosphingobium profundi TaxID=1774954 RepID=UPI001BD9E2C0|nr:STAS domain-containing protein [Novosphingobium profundi]MBT0670557.1 STAS domain-containing protein [Novosphingobium profundi]
MPIQPDAAVAEPLLCLPAIGSTATAEDLRDSLLASAGHEDGFRIDASEVEAIGQAVLQILLAARADAQASGVPFEILNPSTAFLERVNACGLASALGLPEEEIHP